MRVCVCVCAGTFEAKSEVLIEVQVKSLFDSIDSNKDGKISLEDFDELFCSYGGAKMDSEIWHELLKEADKNGDGVVSENEFTEAMCNIIRKSLAIRKTYK